jgi:hypothetical protein
MKKIALIFFSLFISLISFAVDIPAEIISAINTGNASKLSSYFNTTLELTMPEKEGVYSNTQGEVLIKNFFTQFPPKFEILHQGGKESSKYAIGNYTSENKVFRITLFFKSEGTKLLIHQMRIENEYVE